MSTRKKYDSRARADDGGPNSHTGSTSKLLQRLLHKMAGVEGQRGAGTPRPPPGQRSGSGADSVAPYLDEVRNTRPGPLE